MKALSVKNGACVALIDIPLLSYDDFYAEIVEALSDINLHCVNYFAYPQSDSLRLYACLADDAQGDIHILSCEVAKDAQLPAISAKVHAMERFERELNENHGLRFLDHPWMKPVRYAHDRADKTQVMDNYPFYSIKGENLHEVGVGPIHAGIIEPGHFRFICDGEKVLHLEIHLGYQHRDVENLMLQKDKLIQRSLLAESTAGDTAVGHGTAFAMLWESL
ncbi:MAG: NADH dehydrogenase subunit, partial [Bacteroidales bacterium]|nr:NADH dehydrogenase subunit [Bacteroidales bacterium]